MHFHFDELRATQAAAVLLRLRGGQENYTWLLKALYLADRKSLEVTGSPIAGARFVNMANGPVASDIYDCIKGHRCETWARFIARCDRYDLRLIGDPGDSELSDFDVETLTSLFAQFRQVHYGGMIDHVHTLPEWCDPGTTSMLLDPADILRAVGVAEDTISEVDQRNRHVDAVRVMLG